MMNVKGNWNTTKIRRSKLKQDIIEYVKEDLYEKVGWNKVY